LDIETFPVAVQTFRDLQFFPVTVKGIAYIEAAASVKNIKTMKLYFHVLNKGTVNKLTD
jgi:glutamine amidotransferase-like uncharacterized protein